MQEKGDEIDMSFKNLGKGTVKLVLRLTSLSMRRKGNRYCRSAIIEFKDSTMGFHDFWFRKRICLKKAEYEKLEQAWHKEATKR